MKNAPRRIGAPPPLVIPTIPDQAPLEYQKWAKDLIDRLIDSLHMVDPPDGHGGVRYLPKYNAKVDPKAFLLRSPLGTFVAIHLDELRTCANWDLLARKYVKYLREEHAEVMDAQTSTRSYDEIGRISGGRN